MRILQNAALYAVAIICALISLWLIFCIFGLWFIGPPKPADWTVAHAVLWNLGGTALLILVSVIFGAVSRGAFRRARAYPSK